MRTLFVIGALRCTATAFAQDTGGLRPEAGMPASQMPASCRR